MERLSEVLISWRREKRFTVRYAAAEIGISVATYSRIERGATMDGKTLGKIIKWMLTCQANQERDKLRDMFAAAALTGLIADHKTNLRGDTVQWAYEYADEMLKARERKP